MMSQTNRTIATLGCVSIALLFAGIQICKYGHPSTAPLETRSPNDADCPHAAYQIPPARRLAISVERKCAQTGGTKRTQGLAPRVQSQILVSDRYRLMFCYVPKVASSNIKRLFLVLGNIFNTSELSNINNNQVNNNFDKIKKLKSYSLNGRNYRLRHYTKVMITREPYERLISAYRSKFESGIKVKDPGSLSLRAAALRVLNTGIKRENQGYLTQLTFANYIRFLGIQTSVGKALNYHFAAQVDLCDPCNIVYDYIGTYENIDADLQLFLTEVGAENSVKFPSRKDYYKLHKKSEAIKTVALLNEYYSKVPPVYIRQLRQHLTSRDADLFGYEFPETLAKISEN